MKHAAEEVCKRKIRVKSSIVLVIFIDYVIFIYIFKLRDF